MSNVRRIICADWGKEIKKRAAYEVFLDEQRVRRLALENLTVESLLRHAGEGSLPTLVAFDAPIGVPKSFMDAVQKTPAGSKLTGFVDWLDSTRFESCDGAARWSLEKPFFAVPPEGGHGSRRAFSSAAAQLGVDLRRLVEKQTNGNAAFMTAGAAGSVGSAARDIWKGFVHARKSGYQFRLWPFEGPLDALQVVDGPVVGEIYPRAAYATALVDHAPRPRMSISKANKKGAPPEKKGLEREHALERLHQTLWVKSSGARFENLDDARQNEDAFDALMTAAALLRCVIEGLPLYSSSYCDPVAEGAILGTGSIDLTMRETKFSKFYGGSPGLPS